MVHIWVEAARPKTLAAALVPVSLGAALAFRHGLLDVTASVIALLCAVLIQIGTNFANDYFDFVKGTDTEERIGFTRATAAGLIAPKTMWRATVITMLLAFLLGLVLVWKGGWVILAIGLASLLFGIAYTGGPFPLGYNGLGDVFVFLFFGFVAVIGTYFVNGLTFSWEAFWISIPAGALSTNILVVNNLRDSETDKKSGKKTLGVLLGDYALKVEYLVMIGLAFSIPLHVWFWNNYSEWIFLPFLTLPFAGWLLLQIFTVQDKRILNGILEKTAQFMTLFGLLFTIGILLA